MVEEFGGWWGGKGICSGECSGGAVVARGKGAVAAVFQSLSSGLNLLVTRSRFGVSSLI